VDNFTIQKALVVGLDQEQELEVSNFFARKGIDVKVSDVKGKNLHGRDHR